MLRHDQDEWDIVTSVGLTALAVAGARALESRRAEPLIVDPYAETLVTAADADIPIPTRSPSTASGKDDELAALWEHIATGMGLRSRFFDEFITESWAGGVRQVVILAAGLDARAWRLPWPADATVFEIDQPRVLRFKDDVFTRENTEPVCARHAVPIDLREDWPSALEQSGFDRTRPTAWLAEGLLMYLPEDAEARLLSAMHELSAPGSRIAVEHIRSLKDIIRKTQGDAISQASEQFGMDISELFYDNEDRLDPAEQLNTLGWHNTVTTGEALATTYGRVEEDSLNPLTQHQRYVTAHLPS